MAGPMRIKEHARAKKGTMKRLLKTLISKYKWSLLLVLICLILNIFTNLSGSIFASFITEIVEKAIKTGSTNPFFETFTINALNIVEMKANLTGVILTLAGIYVLAVIVSYTWNRTMAIITQKYLNDTREAMFQHMESLPIKYFDTHAHGDIMSNYTNDVDTIRQFVSQALPSLVQTGLTVVGCLVIMLCFSVWMTLIVLMGTFAMFLNTKYIGGRSSRYFVKQQKSVGVVEGHIEEAFTGLKVIKVFTHEEESQKDFEKKNAQLCEYSKEANIMGNIMGPINGNVGNFVYVFVAILGAILYITPGSYNLSLAGGLIPVDAAQFYSKLLVPFLMLARMFSNNINMFSQQITFIVMGMAGASRVFDLLDEVPEADEGYVTLVHIKKDKDGNIVETDERTRDYAWKHPHKADGTITYTELKGDIVLDKVDFSYDGKKTILEDVSVYAHPGQMIALVGATGAGKTTITNLINRFYDIADGKIRYDGININKIKKDDLRRSLGIVLQDVNLFTGTVMENIRYGRLDATDEEVYEAAKIANAYDFIMRLPEGFNTMLKGDGSNLSQGQRQLLSIARAAVADAPVMILDEATSSIDTRTEKLVQSGMEKIMKGRTVFVIAHRLSTVQNANAIMVMDHGHIIERGNHEELIAQKGTYYRLYTGAFELE